MLVFPQAFTGSHKLSKSKPKLSKIFTGKVTSSRKVRSHKLLLKKIRLESKKSSTSGVSKYDLLTPIYANI